MSNTMPRRKFSQAWNLLLSIAILLGLAFGVGPTPTAASENAAANTLASSAPSGPTHKVIAAPGVLDTSVKGVTLWHDYGSFALYRVSDAALNALPADARSQITLGDDMDRLLIDALDAQPLGIQMQEMELLGLQRLRWLLRRLVAGI